MGVSRTLLLWLVIIFVRQDALRISFGIVILVGAYGEDEKRQPEASKDQRNRYEIGKDIHADYLSLNAFKDTVIELNDMANAAINGVAKPATANGTAMIL